MNDTDQAYKVRAYTVRREPNTQLPGRVIYTVVRWSDDLVLGQHATKIQAQRHCNQLNRGFRRAI